MSKKESNLNVNASKDIKENSIMVNESKELPENSNQNQTKEINLEKQQSNLHEALKQTDLFQGSASTLLQNTSYPKDHWVVLESMLQRNGIATKPTKFTLEVIGIYSIPEWWEKLEQSGAIDNWYYQVNVGEAKCINGKMNLRELTEEEKNNAENKKKPPPKVDKKNPEAVKAEEERLKAIQDERDLAEKKFYDELKKLEKINQFYKIKEMPTQAEWISFPDEDKSNTVELKNDSLIYMENCINENHEIIIEVNKVPPPDDNEKKRPKPKNMNPEDIKPVYSVGVADLKEFYLVPGKKEVILRTPLMLKETYEKRKENNIEPISPLFEPKENDLKVYLFGPPLTTESDGKKEKEKEKKEEKEKKDDKEKKEEKDKDSVEKSEYANEDIELDYIEEAHTYIYYKLSFSESINPKIPGFGDKIEPADLIQENTIKVASSAPDEKFESLTKPDDKEKDKLNKSHNLENEKDIKKVLEEAEEEKEKVIQIIPEKNKESMPINKRYEDKIEKQEPKDQIIKEDKKIEEEEPEPTRSIPANEMCSDFRKYIKIFINLICKKYDEITGGDSSKNQAAKRDKGGSILSNVKKDERDQNINKFLTKFIENGQTNLIKEKLKKFITRIILEKYKKRPNINEKFAEQKDKFFSEVYAYICDEIKLGMDEFIHMKKDEIHEHILSSYESSRKELMAYAIRKNKEPEEKRLLRLSNEYEILDDLETSMKYYKNRLTLVQNKDIWLNFAILSKKMNNLIQVEESINYCINIIDENEQIALQGTQSTIISQKNDKFNFSILHSSIKYLKGRMKDAVYIILHIINKYKLEKTNCSLNAFLAFLYHEMGNNLLFTKHYEAAKRFKMIDLGFDLRKPKFNPKVKTKYKSPSLTNEQCNTIWYNLITFFNEHEFCEISEKLLEFIDEEGKDTIEFKLAKSKICLFFKRNDEVISLCNEILKRDEKNYLAWILRGHAYYFKNNLFDSEESYIKGIKFKDKKSKFDIKMLTRLGIIYIRRKTWNDAKVVFLHILKDSVYHSFAWRYLGLALTHLGEYDGAEEALDEAILLDIENPLTWAYLTMFCINVGRREHALACLNELIKMKFNQIEITSDIALLFYKNNDFNIAANLYKRIINFDKTYIDAQVKLAEIYFMKFDEPKKKEAIEILKNSLQYAQDEKEKNSILQFIQIYENQIDYAKNSINNQNSIDNTENIGNNMNMDINLESQGNEESEFKDNFD